MLDHPGDHANYFEPFDLGTALITVHKDSSQYRASLGKAAFSARIHLLIERGKPNDDFGREATRSSVLSSVSNTAWA
jgi:hypothetical protein